MRCQVDLIEPFDIAGWDKESALWIYGTGYGGRTIRLLLAEGGVKTKGFLDLSKEGMIDGFECRCLNEDTGPVMPLDTPILLSMAAWVRPANRLIGLGYHRIYDGSSALYQLPYLPGLEAQMRGALSLISYSLIKRNLVDPSAIDPAIEDVIADFRDGGPLSPRASQASVSMLDPSVHAVAQLLVRLFPGPLLEVGTYVGALTVTMTRALLGRNDPIVLIERGGDFYNNVDGLHIPTDDIVRDLIHNLRVLSPQARYELIGGQAQQIDTIASVAKAFAGQKVRILAMDADGDVLRTLDLYAHLLERNCLFILDDFVDGYPVGAENKGERTRTDIFKLTQAGRVTEIGICRGTWFGIIH